jgi:hypothetical protein
MTRPVSTVVASDLVRVLTERTGVKADFARRRLGAWSVQLVLTGAADDVQHSLKVMADLFALFGDRRGLDFGACIDRAVKRRAHNGLNRGSYK